MALVKMVTVEEETKKNSELKKSDLEMLRDWHKKQPHLPPMSDSELALFLHSNYYRVEPTKLTIDTFFTFRAHLPEFFSNRDPLGSKELRNAMKVVYFGALRGSTPEGYKAMYSRILDPVPSHWVFVDILKVCIMTLELWLYTTGSSPGHIMVIDLADTVFGHVARLNPMLMKKFLYYLQEALPIRLKGFYILNTPPFMDTILNMMKPFMKRELMDVLHLENSVETLAKRFPVDLLPNESGGKAGPLKELWAAQLKQMEDHRDWFVDEESRKANEALRPGKAKSVTDLLGVEGSFKKLDID